jgi:anaerobic magnesium-protoporphyrin IX monomethyl ester cyclase
MKVLLIVPPLKVAKEMEEFVKVSFPIGLAYIASVLEENKIRVSILDCLAEGWDIKNIEGDYIRIGLPEEEIIKRIRNESPDICGISSLFSSQKDQPHEIARLIKQEFPKIKIVMGGPHVSGNPLEVLEDKNVDFAVIGEGEETTLNLIKNLKKPEKINGLAYKKSGNIKINPPAKFIANIDKIPFPAYHLLKMQKYFEAGEKGMSARRYIGESPRWATIITSRGCPFDCVFCSIHNTMGYKWRPRSAKNVVDEVEFLYKTYNIKTFFFEDDNFSLNQARAKEILRDIIKRKLDITWQAPNGIRADMIDDELLSLMKKTNCTRIRIAIEHGDQKFLNEVVGKRLDLKILKDVVKKIRKNKMDIDGFFILGIPGETEQTMRNSINFAKELSSYGMNPIIGMAIPLPGTRMYKICEENQYLIKDKLTSRDYQLAYSKEPVINTPTMPAQLLKKWYFRSFKETLLVRLRKDPKVLLNLNIVQEFKKSPLKALRITYANIKTALK